MNASTSLARHESIARSASGLRLPTPNVSPQLCLRMVMPTKKVLEQRRLAVTTPMRQLHSWTPNISRSKHTSMTLLLRSTSYLLNRATKGSQAPIQSIRQRVDMTTPEPPQFLNTHPHSSWHHARTKHGK